MKDSKFDFSIRRWPILLTVFLPVISVAMVLGLTQQITRAERPLAKNILSSVALAQRSVVFVPPPGEGAPSRTVGGASRTGFGAAKLCPADEPTPGGVVSWPNAPTDISQRMVALLPSEEQHGTLHLTTESHPSFFLYMPEMSVKEAFFSIQGENGEYYYSQDIDVPDLPSVVKISLPADEAQALKLDQPYRWFLVLKCEGQLGLENPLVRGSVKRVAVPPTLQQQFTQEDQLEQAILYGQNGIWYDTLDYLAAAVQTESASMAQWSNLLRSMGFGEIAEAPLTH